MILNLSNKELKFGRTNVELQYQTCKFVLSDSLPFIIHWPLQRSNFINVAKSIGHGIKTAARSVWSFGKRILAKGANFFRNIPINTINAIDAIRKNKHFSLH